MSYWLMLIEGSGFSIPGCALLCVLVPEGGGGGGTRSINVGEVQRTFGGLKIYNLAILFGSRGLKVCLIE